MIKNALDKLNKKPKQPKKQNTRKKSSLKKVPALKGKKKHLSGQGKIVQKNLFKKKTQVESKGDYWNINNMQK